MFSLLINFLLTVNVVVSLLIILLVLMQRPKSEGLGAAFGGGMTENLFGAQTSNVLANATRWLGGIFFALTLLLSILYARQSMQKSSIQKSVIEKALAATPAPSASPAASAAPAAGASPVAKAKVSATPGISALSSPAASATPAPAKAGGTSSH